LYGKITGEYGIKKRLKFFFWVGWRQRLGTFRRGFGDVLAGLGVVWTAFDGAAAVFWLRLGCVWSAPGLRRTLGFGGFAVRIGGSTGEFSWVAGDNSYVDNMALVQFLPFWGIETPDAFSAPIVL
jgi:hypothetical protein